MYLAINKLLCYTSTTCIAFFNLIKIKKGIVFSYDIERILNDINAYDFKYNFIPSKGLIKDLINDFVKDVNKVFNNEVTIVSEEEMLEVNKLIGGGYPHCYSR